jgi:hypothetical protein
LETMTVEPLLSPPLSNQSMHHYLLI